MKNKLPFAFVVVGLLLAGCKSEPQNLASQIGAVTTTIGPYTGSHGEAWQEVRFHIRNNGPKPIGSITANLDVFNADGTKNDEESRDHKVIYAADIEAHRLKAGQEFTDPPGEGHILAGQSFSRVTVTVLEADDVATEDLPGQK